MGGIRLDETVARIMKRFNMDAANFDDRDPMHL